MTAIRTRIVTAAAASTSCRLPYGAAPVRSSRNAAPGHGGGHAAPALEPRQLADGLDDLLGDGTPVAPAIRASAAARGFAVGNGFATGRIVDRTL